MIKRAVLVAMLFGLVAADAAQAGIFRNRCSGRRIVIFNGNRCGGIFKSRRCRVIRTCTPCQPATTTPVETAPVAPENTQPAAPETAPAPPAATKAPEEASVAPPAPQEQPEAPKLELAEETQEKPQESPDVGPPAPVVAQDEPEKPAEVPFRIVPMDPNRQNQRQVEPTETVGPQVVPKIERKAPQEFDLQDRLPDFRFPRDAVGEPQQPTPSDSVLAPIT